ncbi:hypothetical protein Dsin_001582 [Dipteronia sinensis]|uniref:RNase H type-1 domain-containing protein n=1 Tax=Dipteronia sinensis TaxID=43782 RepID=A0AAE0EIL3_9ROSI|nr:hypothetical protein Dsin_001582 [Dipteronia sinensis]
MIAYFLQKLEILSVYVIRRILEDYSSASDQLVNFSKSVVGMSKVISYSEGDRLVAIIGVMRVRCHERFWWGSTETTKKMYWASWKRLCGNKNAGGLGFRNISVFSQALLTKQGWRLIKFPNSLPTSSFLKADRKQMDSIWSSLCWGRDLLEYGSRWRVGSGTSIRIYEDRWLHRPVIFKVISPCVHDNVILVSQLRSESDGWNNQLVRQLFFKEDTEMILSIPLSYTFRDDFLTWHYTTDGEYTDTRDNYTYALGMCKVEGGSVQLWLYEGFMVVEFFTLQGFLHFLCPEYPSANMKDVVGWSINYLAIFKEAKDVVDLVQKRLVVAEEVRWEPPTERLYKINTDGSIQAVAILRGIEFAKDMGLLPEVVKSDTLGVVKLINAGSIISADLGFVLSDILHNLSNVDIEPVLYVSRKANMVAHSISKMALSISQDCFWVEEFPPSVGNLVLRGLPL